MRRLLGVLGVFIVAAMASAEEFPRPADCDVGQLTTEVKAVVSSLAGMEEDVPRNVVNVRKLGGGRFTQAEQEAISAAFTAHVPTPPVDPDAELAQAIQDATTLDALKNALLGKTRKGKVKAERP